MEPCVVSPFSIGRNEKCVCGSGKKYKRCCLLKSFAQKEAVGTESQPTDDMEVIGCQNTNGTELPPR